MASRDATTLAIGAATGVVLALLGSSPTGATVTDVIVLVLCSTAAVWCASAAPWWAIAALSGLGAVLAGEWAGLVLGAVTFAGAVVLGAKQEQRRWIWAMVVAASIVVLATARDLGAWGTNALVAIGAVVVVAALGLYRREGQRRTALIAIGATAALAVVALGALAYVANDARSDLSDGNRIARQGLRQLESADFDDARTSFAEATTAFERASSALDSPIATPARMIPIASQHLSAGRDVSAAAEHATRTVESQLDVIDLDSLRIVDGQIDVDAVAGLVEPMHALQAALDDLDTAVHDADSGWLVDSVRNRLDEIALDIDEQRTRGDKALAALEVAPELLGAEGPRTYFVMFTSPAEARGLGGFMGNWAEITIDQGNIMMTAFGNDELLNEGGQRPRALENAPSGWVSRFGQFGFTNGEGRTVGEVPWKNITMSPDFPATSQVVSELYPQSGGSELDGVISLDVYALEALIDLVGPIAVDGTSELLTGDNAADYLLLGQYVEFGGQEAVGQEARGDMLEAVTRKTVDRFLYTAPPDPIDLGRAMAPFVDERRLLAWSSEPDVQNVISAVGLDGALRRDDRDLAAVTFDNAGGSKIDVFLDQSFDVVDGPSGPQIRVELTNNAPADGLPDYVIGNVVGLPKGSSRLWVTGLASVPVVSMTNGDEAVDTQSSFEAGMHTLSGMVDLGPGESTTVVFELDADDRDASDFGVLRQPLVRRPVARGD